VSDLQAKSQLPGRKPPGRFARAIRPTWPKALTILGVIAAIGLAVYFWFAYAQNAVFAPVVEGRIYRSPQPTGRLLERYIRKYHFGSIISLRGQETADVLEEKAIAQSAGVDFYVFHFSAGELPAPEQLIRLIQVLEDCRKPALLHCRSGVDRAGMASAVAVMVLGSGNLDQAMRQLPAFKTNPDPDHVSDLLRQYAKYCRDRQLDPNGAARFKSWAGCPGFDLVPPSDMYTGKSDSQVASQWRLYR
jgi:protein tyrosine phosphatase (PTP) superfamily phosphohydrolase (DUF442 family)